MKYLESKDGKFRVTDITNPTLKEVPVIVMNYLRQERSDRNWQIRVIYSR